MADQVYMHYRNSSIGSTLTDALDDMIQTGTLQAPIANRVLSHFDRHIVMELQKLTSKASFRAHLSTYRNCDDVWTFILRDVQFRLNGNETLNADRVKIIACKRSDLYLVQFELLDDDDDPPPKKNSIDNSEYMRNGDYLPTRHEAQGDAINLVFNAKTQSNPENTVALMTMAGNSPEVLVTLTNEFWKILSAMHRVQIAGKSNFSTGIQIAQLLLKHRQNKNQRQRVIVFVGSPLIEEEKDLVKLAKRLKKNNISVDIVNFGEFEENSLKLEAFITTLNSPLESRILTVEPGSNLLSDALLSSSIIHGDSESGATVGGGGFEFGVDPTLDPELAMALRMSLEEERARQEQEAAGQQSEAMDIDQHDPGNEDDELQRALLMSMDESSHIAVDQQNEVDDTVMQDILGTLPGVDPNDPRIQDAMKKDKRGNGHQD